MTCEKPFNLTSKEGHTCQNHDGTPFTPARFKSDNVKGKDVAQPGPHSLTMGT